MIFYLFFPFAILFIAIGGWSLMRNVQARKWKPIEGIIVESTIVEVRTTATSDSSSGNLAGYTISLRWRYSVSNVEHYGAQKSFGGDPFRRRNRKEVEDLFPRYQPGGSIQIYFDPNQPQRSVLQHSPLSASLIMLMLGILLLVVGIAGVIFEWG